MVARNKLVINGNLADGAEQWSCGISFASPVAQSNIETPAGLQDWADDAMNVLLGTTGSTDTLLDMLGTTGSIENCTAYYYPATGPAVAVGVSTVPAIPGGGTPSKPAQCAVAISLSTGIAGRSFRGRFYWPAVNIGMGADLRLSSIAQNSIADEMQDVLNLITDAATGFEDFTPVVYSAARNLVTPVTSLLVGNVIDTQRRRRENLVETYVTRDVEGGA